MLHITSTLILYISLIPLILHSLFHHVSSVITFCLSVLCDLDLAKVFLQLFTKLTKYFWE